MDFQRTKRTLHSLEGNSALSAEETLGIIMDVLADVRAVTGKSPDALELGDIREALSAMSALGRVILQINKSNADVLGTAEDRKKRFDKISGDLENVCRDIENSSDVIEALSQRQSELQQKLGELEESQKKAVELKQSRWRQQHVA